MTGLFTGQLIRELYGEIARQRTHADAGYVLERLGRMRIKVSVLPGEDGSQFRISGPTEPLQQLGGRVEWDIFGPVRQGVSLLLGTRNDAALVRVDGTRFTTEVRTDGLFVAVHEGVVQVAHETLAEGLQLVAGDAAEMTKARAWAKNGRRLGQRPAFDAAVAEEPRPKQQDERPVDAGVKRKTTRAPAPELLQLDAGRAEVVPSEPAPLPRLARGPYELCRNEDLMRAMESVLASSVKGGCDFDLMAEVKPRFDKRQLIAILRNPDVYSVHIFYPAGKTKVTDALDWASKQRQLASLKKLASTSDVQLIVIGRTAGTGGTALNRKLARERVTSLLSFLTRAVKIPCEKFYSAWFGAEILQLTESDVPLVDIPPSEYRGSIRVFNQATHVIVLPCRRLQ